MAQIERVVGKEKGFIRKAVEGLSVLLPIYIGFGVGGSVASTLFIERLAWGVAAWGGSEYVRQQVIR